MLIRKNTKAFKTILEIVQACQERADRERLIRLYITRAGHSVKERISVESIQGEAALFYEMNYQSVLNNLQSPNHQLHHSDEIPGIYFFHSTSNKIWDETPFEFDVIIEKEFKSLPELPLTRKKEKLEKFIFPSGRSEGTRQEKEEKVKSVKPIKAKVSESGPKQPDYKLKRKVDFTYLEKIIFKQFKVEKKDVLHYYNNIAPYILPYLKDRHLWTRRQDGKSDLIEMTVEDFFEDTASIYEWIITKKIPDRHKQKQMLLCNDREHLLFYVESGSVEFNPGHSGIKSLRSPDYIVIALDSPEYELAQATDAALNVKKILDGLQLYSLVKTDGRSGLHIYIPLDSKSKFETGSEVASLICKLIRLKIPDLISIKGSDENSYKKVSLDFSLNSEGGSLVAPYSLVSGEVPVVATPLLWDEITTLLRAEDFNHETIFKRLKKVGDPFDKLFKKKVNADTLLDRMEKNYGFLFD